MTDLRKAAEQALEAFEVLDRRGGLGLDVHEYIRTKIEALRQALAQPVDAVNTSQERVDETAKGEHEPVVWMNKYGHVASFQNEEYKDPLYTAPQKKEWVGYTNEDRKRIVPMLVQSLINHDEKTMAGLLNAILIDIEQQLKEKNSG